MSLNQKINDYLFYYGNQYFKEEKYLIVLLLYMMFLFNSCQQKVDNKLIQSVTTEAGEVGKRVISFENNLRYFRQTYDSLYKALSDTLGEAGMEAMKADSLAGAAFKQLNEDFEKNYQSFESITNTYKSFLLTVNAFVDSMTQDKLKPEEVPVIWPAKKAQSDELYAQGETMSTFVVSWQAKFIAFSNECLRFKAKSRLAVPYHPHN